MRRFVVEDIAVVAYILAWPFAARIDPAYTVFPPVSGPCFAYGEREGKEDLRMSLVALAAACEVASLGTSAAPSGYSVAEDCEVIVLFEMVVVA